MTEKLLVSPEEARQMLEREKQMIRAEMETPGKLRLLETILALWPYVEAWAKQGCRATGLIPMANCGNDRCWPCKARKLLAQREEVRP